MKIRLYELLPFIYYALTGKIRMPFIDSDLVP